MKPSSILQTLALSALLFVRAPTTLHAQTNFDSGSNGSFGPLVVDDTTGNRVIQLPPDGILHCTTVTIVGSNQLTFTKNAANTPVYILATGDVTINGYILIDGETNVARRGGDGGPGGYGGGLGDSNPSNGFGPGAGKGGWGGYTEPPPGKSSRGAGGYGTAGTPLITGGKVYGNSLLIPLVGGSGGGGAEETNLQNQVGGGGGGGALLIASNTKITFGHPPNRSISAAGGNSVSPFGSVGTGGGSGGAIRLVAPLITGSATLRIEGRAGGGFGRIRVDALTNSLNLFDSGSGSPNYATFGTNMVVFPNLPNLRVTKAAGHDIALTQVEPVLVMLPVGASATQTIEVQARNFGAVVPLVAVVTPETGDRSTYNFEIDNTAGGASKGGVDVQIPAGVSTRIDVWTR